MSRIFTIGLAHAEEVCMVRTTTLHLSYQWETKYQFNWTKKSVTKAQTNYRMEEDGNTTEVKDRYVLFRSITF